MLTHDNDTPRSPMLRRTLLRSVLPVAAFTAAVVACTPTAPPGPTTTTTAPPAGTPTLTRTDLVTGLANPWDIAFTPDGTMLFTERAGRVDAWVGGAKRTLAQPSDL